MDRHDDVRKIDTNNVVSRPVAIFRSMSFFIYFVGLVTVGLASTQMKNYSFVSVWKTQRMAIKPVDEVQIDWPFSKELLGALCPGRVPVLSAFPDIYDLAASLSGLDPGRPGWPTEQKRQFQDSRTIPAMQKRQFRTEPQKEVGV